MIINDVSKARSCQRFVQKYADKDVTKQSQKKEADINWIVAQAKKFGSLDPFNKPVQGFYADVSSVPDFQEAMAVVQKADEAFMSLGPDVRKRFHNDPGEMLEFLSKEENRAEGEKLGLFVPVAKEVPSGEGNTAPVKIDNGASK